MMGRGTETKVDRVRRHWKAKANKSDIKRKIWEERYQAQRARTVKLSNAIDSLKDKHSDELALYRVASSNENSQRRELERINANLKTAIGEHIEGNLDLTRELADLRRSNFRLICILDNVTHPERGK